MPDERVGPAGPGSVRRTRPFRSRLGRRLLLLHLLLLLLPIGGMLYLRSFESRLLEQEERTMVAEARWIAAALAPSAAEEPLPSDGARALLAMRERPLDARVRVVDADATLVADTAPLGRRGRRRIEIDARPRRELWLYRVGASVWTLVRNLLPTRSAASPPEPAAELGSKLEIAEVTGALAEGYGSATRLSPDGELLILSSAVPIVSGDRAAGGRIVGAVVVSRSTLDVLEALDRVRLDVFRVLLASVAVAIALSILFARLMVRPLTRLRDEAERLLDERGRIASRFTVIARRDEIGDLARSLAALSDRLASSVGELDRFASELAHELKNPLAAIRAAAELAVDAEDPAERQRLKAITDREIGRAERLLSELQAMAALERDEGVELPTRTAIAPFVRRLRDGWTQRRAGVKVTISGELPEASVALDEARLARVVENLLDNAVSHAPQGSEVELAARRLGDEVELEVADRGPGVPEEHRERIFDRFFTWRPAAEEAGDEEPAHLGLGLDIARTIARRAGGDLTVHDRPDGPGALFRLTLPRG